MKRVMCRDIENVTSTGIEINASTDGFLFHQQQYIFKLDKLSDLSIFQRYRSLRAKLSWAGNTSPDISCAISHASQVTDSMYAKEPLTYIKGLTAVVKHLRKASSFTLKYPKFDINSLTLKVHTDASYANNFDGSSQFGYIIFLADASGNRQSIFLSSRSLPEVASRDEVGA
jgi:hypothetical protein